MMKKTLLTFMLIALATIVSQTQDLHIHKTDGTTLTVPLNSIDSITFFEGGTTFICGSSTVTDIEGNVYNTVLIGDQCWMAENLNIGIMIQDGNTMANNDIIEKYCYNNYSSNCDTYGGLYQWNEMMDYTATPGTQGICPDGWHIPTDNEWNILEGTVDSQYGVGDPEWLNENERGFDAGGNLKEIGLTNWNPPNTGATNTSGFTSLPGGGRTNGFYSIHANGVYWTSSETGNNAWIHSQYYTWKTSARAPRSKNYAYSIRCIKN